MASAAATWGEHLAQTGEFDHSPPEARDGHGENLWAGTKKAFPPEEMVGDWMAERPYYKPGTFPDMSTTDDWTDVGHYTQVVWSTTSRVGCSLADGQQETYLVCRFCLKRPT